MDLENISLMLGRKIVHFLCLFWERVKATNELVFLNDSAIEKKNFLNTALGSNLEIHNTIIYH